MIVSSEVVYTIYQLDHFHNKYHIYAKNASVCACVEQDWKKKMSAIYRNSPLPRYYQLKEIMRERVRAGEWKPGDLIPSERELGETYGISRMTARQAITDLVNEGLFYREQGKGTFVSRNKITQQLIRLTGFSEDIKARGQRPGSKIISAKMVPADETIAER